MFAHFEFALDFHSIPATLRYKNLSFVYPKEKLATAAAVKFLPRKNPCPNLIPGNQHPVELAFCELLLYELSI